MKKTHTRDFRRVRGAFYWYGTGMEQRVISSSTKTQQKFHTVLNLDQTFKHYFPNFQVAPLIKNKVPDIVPAV